MLTQEKNSSVYAESELKISLLEIQAGQAALLQVSGFLGQWSTWLKLGDIMTVDAVEIMLEAIKENHCELSYKAPNCVRLWTKTKPLEVMAPQARVMNWPRRDIVHQLHKKGLTLELLSEMNGLSRFTVKNALDKKYRRGEQIIAKALGVTPETIWPERYDTMPLR